MHPRSRARAEFAEFIRSFELIAALVSLGKNKEGISVGVLSLFQLDLDLHLIDITADIDHTAIYVDARVTFEVYIF